MQDNIKNGDNLETDKVRSTGATGADASDADTGNDEHSDQASVRAGITAADDTNISATSRTTSRSNDASTGVTPSYASTSVTHGTAVDTPVTGTTPKNLKWLNSMRALGVVLVLIYHFFPDILPGGFIGVDIFFVVSGYLITSLLIREYEESGRLRLPAFYWRRWRRLFPALLAMLFVCLPLLFLINPDFRVGIMQQTAAALSWTTNYFEILTGQSYEAQLLPHLFIHTWTLSVEMQYYLVWGLLVLGIFALTKATPKLPPRFCIIIATVIITVASAVLMWALASGANDPSVAYMLTPSHIFPLMIGSLFGALGGFSPFMLKGFLLKSFAPVPIKPGASAQPQAGGDAFKPLSLILIVAGIIAILFISFTFSFNDPHTYQFGILVVSLISGMILYLARFWQDISTRKEWAISNYIGIRSYSIYLFHWPLMIIATEVILGFGVDPTTAALIAAAIGIPLTFSFAELSYRFVEQPFRIKRLRPEDEAEAKAAKFAALLGESNVKPVRSANTSASASAASGVAWSPISAAKSTTTDLSPEAVAAALNGISKAAPVAPTATAPTAVAAPDTEIASTSMAVVTTAASATELAAANAATMVAAAPATATTAIDPLSSTDFNRLGKVGIVGTRNWAKIRADKQKRSIKILVYSTAAVILLGTFIALAITAPRITSIDADLRAGALEISVSDIESAYENTPGAHVSANGAYTGGSIPGGFFGVAGFGSDGFRDVNDLLGLSSPDDYYDYESEEFTDEELGDFAEDDLEEGLEEDLGSEEDFGEDFTDDEAFSEDFEDDLSDDEFYDDEFTEEDWAFEDEWVSDDEFYGEPDDWSLDE